MCAICNFTVNFGISHPSALSVAVATRTAIEAGLVEATGVAEGALAEARARMSAVEVLNLLQASIEEALTEEALIALPDFYVLLIENDTWGFFHATNNGFDPDIVPEMPDLTTTDDAKRGNIVIMSEAGLRAWLEGRFDVERAVRESLFMIEATRKMAVALTRMLTVAETYVTVSETD